MDYTIRKANESDKSVLTEIARRVTDKCSRKFLDDEIVDEYINSGACDEDIIKDIENTQVLIKEEKIIGLIIWNENILQGLIIDIPYFGTGAAQYLVENTMKDRLENFGEVTLECFENNSRANAFYKKTGWTQVGKIKDDITKGYRLVYTIEQ